MNEKPKQGKDHTLVELSSKRWGGVIAAGYVIATIGAVGFFVSCLGFNVADSADSGVAGMVMAKGMTVSMFASPSGLMWAAAAHIGRWWVHG